MPTVIREVPHIERLARWCHRYVTLSIRELHLSANARKFKILQSQRWVNTELDVALYSKLFPSQMHEGVRKYPTVVRGALKVNGVDLLNTCGADRSVEYLAGGVCAARGLPVERFGSGSNARNFKNWKYAKAPECGLPVTADIISRAFDVRLPLLFEEEDFEIMVEIIQESLAEVAAGELEVKEQEVAYAR